ncbi:DUF6932 family protein [Pseudomonas sp.]|uniref:DUF6932 family protein n=1 Tax=Pseudomonas sp. TaxID=306 RepID=UPI003FD87CBA
MNLIKVDFPPMLGEGFHPFSLDDLKVFAVDEFPDSRRRPLLFESLKMYVGLLEVHGLAADVWVDGSFMCQKHEPDDIDMVVVFDPACIRDMTLAAKNAVFSLLKNEYAKARFGLDVRSVRMDDEEGKLFWRKKFGTQRDEITPKGLALLRLKP